MSPERYQQIEQLYHAALERTQQQRADFLQAAANADVSLRSEVESLLAYDGASADFLEEPPGDIAAEVFGVANGDTLVGKSIGHYQIHSIAGVGGMGEVYVAEDTKLKRIVAIKLLPKQYTVDPDRVRRFEQEARAISALNHPNIITIHEIGYIDGMPYLVTERVAGETVRERIKQGPLTPGAVLDIALQITAALDAAHRAGVIHRDIKPENVMVRSDGLVKVLDFGLAKLAEQDASRTDAAPPGVVHTEPGLTIGTMNYMSPEQALGKPVDHRTDLFSLGVVLYEMVTGKRPLLVGNPAAAVPPRFEPLIARLLAEKPDARYQSAADVRAELRKIQRDIETDGNAWFKRLKWQAAGVIILALGGVVFGWLGRGSSRQGSAKISSLAILPFRQLNAQKDGPFLGFGIANEIITRLAPAAAVTVRPTSAIRQYLDHEVDVLTAARQLRVDAVLDGSYQRADARIRVSVNLLRTSDGSSLWAEAVDLPAEDILDLQKDVSEKIAEKLKLRLGNLRVARRRTSNPQAYEYYAKAMYYFGDRGFDSRSRHSMDTAIDLFKRAIELDPNYADARAGLAYAYAWGDWWYEEKPEWIERAKEQIRIAEEFDSTLPSIHIVRSLFLCNGHGCDVEAATRELLLAQQVDPSAAHIELAAMYGRMGMEDKEKQEQEAALIVDPTNTILKDAAVVGRYMTARPDEALQATRKFFQRGPDAWYYTEKRMSQEAAIMVSRGDLVDPTSVQAYIVRALLPALQGHYSEAEAHIPALIEKARAYPYLYYVVARIYALQGKNEEAMKWLLLWANGFCPCYPAYVRDPFLERIRQYGPFVQFMADMKRRWERYRREFG
jgi:eukaryotic-like serine/threonine-protein kinase